MSFSAQITGVESTAPPGTKAPGGGITVGGWVWAVIAIVVVGIVIAILLVVVILAVRRRDRPKQ